MSASKIVYHGTFESKPPHEYDQETFHAGTRKAADDRLDEAEEAGGIATMHAYEISDTAPTSRVKDWEDPYNRGGKIVPEHKTNRIYPYTNAVEDAGSTSYVIPSHFVGKHVKHLGPQFQELRGEDGQAIANAMTVMSGGRYQRS
jgi:hypothetical protein